MGDPAVQLKAVGAATEELHETAKQALEWVRVSEERVVEAEARADRVHAEVKERALATLRKLGEEGRERVAAERGRRKEAEARAGRAEEARDRAEKAFEQAQVRALGDREAFTVELGSVRADAEKSLAEELERLKREAERAGKEMLDQMKLEADQRVAAAEQRAAEAEAAASEAHEIAVRLEAEIEERVMQGTEDVRREAEERVRALVEKVEGEATEKARARAEEALKAESERIKMQAEQREERVRRAAEDEIKASTSRARREVLAAADATAPSWARREAAASGSGGYRTF
ncbi:MAG: hypothetical protein ACJ75S_00310 [Solirubrobacterales bacterium]